MNAGIPKDLRKRGVLFQRSGDTAEAFDGGTVRQDRCENYDRDAGGDHRIFDRRGAAHVAQETAKSR
jgi:hypothetical protein